MIDLDITYETGVNLFENDDIALEETFSNDSDCYDSEKEDSTFDCGEFHQQKEDFDSFRDDDDPKNTSTSIDVNVADDWYIESKNVGGGSSLEIQKSFKKRICYWAVYSTVSRNALKQFLKVLKMIQVFRFCLKLTKLYWVLVER